MVAGDVEIDVFEVVLAGAANVDVIGVAIAVVWSLHFLNCNREFVKSQEGIWGIGAICGVEFGGLNWQSGNVENSNV